MTKRLMIVAAMGVVLLGATWACVRRNHDLHEFKSILYGGNLQQIARIEHYGCNYWVVKLRSGRQLSFDVPELEREQLRQSSFGHGFPHVAVDDATGLAILIGMTELGVVALLLASVKAVSLPAGSIKATNR